MQVQDLSSVLKSLSKSLGQHVSPEEQIEQSRYANRAARQAEKQTKIIRPPNASPQHMGKTDWERWVCTGNLSALERAVKEGAHAPDVDNSWKNNFIPVLRLVRKLSDLCILKHNRMNLLVNVLVHFGNALPDSGFRLSILYSFLSWIWRSHSETGIQMDLDTCSWIMQSIVREWSDLAPPYEADEQSDRIRELTRILHAGAANEDVPSEIVLLDRVWRGIKVLESKLNATITNRLKLEKLIHF